MMRIDASDQKVDGPGCSCVRCGLQMGPPSAAILPPRRLLERQNAELAAELLAAQQATGQLSARLDASRTLCDQLQRALVDATGPQVPPSLTPRLAVWFARCGERLLRSSR